MRSFARALNAGAVVTLAALLALVPRSGAAQAAPAAPAPAALTLRQFAQLRWIVGDWRGTGTDGTAQAPFFERYRFADDSTLLVESFADSTRRTVSETSRYELRGGRLGNVGATRWVATRVDSVSADFAPAARARNGFRWERAPRSGARPAAWRATITSTGPNGAPVRRVYLMQRMR